MIRNAFPEDLDSIIKLEQTFGEEAFSPRVLKYHINKGHTLICRENDQTIGYSIVCFRNNSRIARLYSIAVAEPFRGKGYGRALLKASESFALTMDCDHMSLEVAEGNDSARALYASEGYGSPKRIEGYYTDGSASYRLWRTL